MTATPRAILIMPDGDMVTLMYEVRKAKCGYVSLPQGVPEGREWIPWDECEVSDGANVRWVPSL